MLVTQSLMVSLIASFRVLVPLDTGAHLGAQEFHPEHVETLAPDVYLSHVDHTLQAQSRAHRGGGHSVLARPCLGDDALLSEALGQ